MFEGRCECGVVRCRVDGPITDYSHCHCSQCRRLHGEPSRPPAYHIFVGSRAPWHKITDTAPQYDEYPDDD
jgi:hypothetical protein